MSHYGGVMECIIGGVATYNYLLQGHNFMFKKMNKVLHVHENNLNGTKGTKRRKKIIQM